VSRVIFIRHSQPDIADNCCYGQLDMAAEATQLAQAVERLAPLLTAYQVEKILSSPLLRCRQLAEALYPDATIHFYPELKEIDFGRWEGCSWQQIPRNELDGWANSFLNYRLGAVGETVAEFNQRVTDFWLTLQQQLNASGQSQTLLCFSHAGVIRCILGQIQALDLAESSQLPLSMGSITSIKLATEGAQIEFVNR